MANGRLQIQTFNGDTYQPVQNAKVTILNTSEPGKRQNINIQTDSSGLTNVVELDAPPVLFSQAPSKNVPYKLYDIKVEAPGFSDFMVKGCQVFPERTAFQECRLQRTGSRQANLDEINILPNTLVGKYPRKIPEAKIKVPQQGAKGFVVLAQPVVPQYVVVHAGDPDDPSAPNYTVGYKDYIKNVASCEIFSTWPETTIRANIYCINSFVLNRIYTEWYTNKGKNFTITNSTAYDQAFNYGRNIYDNISRIVDELFTTYVKIPGAKQPLLTMYCDGSNVQCPGWLTQWGSKYLGDQGYYPYDILTNFYGTNISLETAVKISGIPSSYPGYTLSVGSSGAAVRKIQTFLNSISDKYPLIPKVAVDGVYGSKTKDAVATFQKIFQLYPTGVVNYPTWYRISDIYVAVNKLAELRGLFVPPVPFRASIDELPKVHYRVD